MMRRPTEVGCTVRVWAMRLLPALLGVGLLLAAGDANAQASSVRSLQGTVTGANHQPLSGAVVKVENVKAETIQSYVTDGSGHYRFKRLDPATDYRVFATFKGHHSKAKKLGMFDSKTDATLDLQIAAK